MENPALKPEEPKQKNFAKRLSIFVAVDVALLLALVFAVVVFFREGQQIKDEVAQVAPQSAEAKPDEVDSPHKTNPTKPGITEIIPDSGENPGLSAGGEKDEESKPATPKPSTPRPNTPSPRPRPTPTPRPKPIPVAPNPIPQPQPRPEPEPAPQEPVDSNAAMVAKNNNYRNLLQDKYKVKIKYGSEMYSYMPAGKIITETLSDPVEINATLAQLDEQLAKYPDNFFSELQGSTLTFFLVKNVEGRAFAGLTDYSIGSEIIITLVTSSQNPYMTAHHEIMHWIDFVILQRNYGQTEFFNRFEALNPAGFVYGDSQNDEYCYFGNNGVNVTNPYFMTMYGRTNVREDRAEIFKMMIGRTYPLSGMFDKNTAMYQKALIISEQISQYFRTAPPGGDYAWNRFL